MTCAFMLLASACQKDVPTPEKLNLQKENISDPVARALFPEFSIKVSGKIRRPSLDCANGFGVCDAEFEISVSWPLFPRIGRNEEWKEYYLEVYEDHTKIYFLEEIPWAESLFVVDNPVNYGNHVTITPGSYTFVNETGMMTLMDNSNVPYYGYVVVDSEI